MAQKMLEDNLDKEKRSERVTKKKIVAFKEIPTLLLEEPDN